MHVEFLGDITGTDDTGIRRQLSATVTAVVVIRPKQVWRDQCTKYFEFFLTL